MPRFLAFRAGGADPVEPADPTDPADKTARAPINGQAERLPALLPSTPEGDDDDALAAFQAEVGGPNPAPPKSQPWRPSRKLYLRVVMGAAAVAAVGGAVAYARIGSLSRAVASPAIAALLGTATVDAHPPGVVTIDGIPRGSTPLVVSLPVGTHEMEVTVGGTTRSLPLTIEEGTAIKQDVEFPTPAVEATGQLEVTSEPSGAQVTIDGAARGVTPLTVGTMAPGEHKVAITKGPTTIRRTVNIQPGATASIAGSIAEVDAAGWITLKAPINLDVLEEGQIIGTTAANRLMLPAGSHRLDLRNATFEVGTTVSVEVTAGKTSTVTVQVPNGLLSVNALPWANVSIDGQDVGSTPLANLSVPVGTHEVVWRNPQLGERRRSVDITARSPVRIGIDFAR